VDIDEIITVDELEDKTLTNLGNCVPNDAYNDNQDSNSRCKMSIVELSPTSNTKIKKTEIF